MSFTRFATKKAFHHQIFTECHHHSEVIEALPHTAADGERGLKRERTCLEPCEELVTTGQGFPINSTGVCVGVGGGCYSLTLPVPDPKSADSKSVLF